ncbi:MAG: hypothetical protein V2I24_09015 [Halieaceae bacterium]|jgi:hypothetical protein|nr:hypothetical protein [Halieaceae bacterium]
MMFHRVSEHLRTQNWIAVGVDLLVVFIGVFAGIEVANWNDARLAAERREQIVAALVTDINDSVSVQREFIDEIDAGLERWENAYLAGKKPAPYYFRTVGSDTAPDTWSMLQQTGLVDLFDPITLFDLSFYYSELKGVGQKYRRYVIFVENEVLPFAANDVDVFYGSDGQTLKATYRANMDRLREFAHESQRMIAWAGCLVLRLEAGHTFATTCARSGFSLEGPEEGR